MMRSDIAVVIIGRNERERIDLALGSAAGSRAVYVDSGSTDGSADHVRATGIETIELEPAGGYSAARGRNAGIERLTTDPSIAYLQMLDGDCALMPGWLAAGAAALDADSGLGAVFGRLSEHDPEASLYNWLCDVEWNTPAGPAAVFGGTVLLRADAVRATGGYRPEMIAGEDPEYALRLRAAGWRITCLPVPMATHDSSITHFGQWWRRTVRAGHAFAELNARYPGSALHDFARNRRRILFWAGVIPAALLAGLKLATQDRAWLWLSAAAVLLVLAQIGRITWRERHHGIGRAFALALFLAVGKYAEMVGLIRYHVYRRRGRRTPLIEYKPR